MEMIPVSEVKEMAAAVYKSGLFQLPSPEAALTLMLLCQAEGLHPIQALRQYHIIEGKPAMRADAMQAAFQRAGGKITWIERSDSRVEATFFHPSGGEVTIPWTIEQAQAARLTGKGTWQRFPRAMLSARVVSEGCRAVFPAVVCGLYTPEEVSDFDDKPTVVRADELEVIRPIANKETAPKTAPKTTPKTAPKDKTKSDSGPVITVKAEKVVETEPAPEPAPATPMAQATEAKQEGEAIIAAKQVAAEIKNIRQLAQRYGCKSQHDFTVLMNIITGKDYQTASQLVDNTERKIIREWLEVAIKEKDNEGAKNNG